MKKVLFTATVDSHILAFHIPFLKYFKEKGYEVHVATNGDEEIPYCDKKIKISFERSPFKLNNLKAISQLRKVVNKEKYDIIHTHTPMGSVVTRLASKQARKKYNTRVIYTAHGFHFFKGAPKKNWLLFYPVEKYLSKYTDTLITINKEDYELAKNKFKKCKDVQYVPGVGIDENKFNIKMTLKEKQELKKSLGLKSDSIILMCVARLDKNKNQGLLIDSVEKIIEENSNIHLLFIGLDEIDGIYQKKVLDKNLNRNIHFIGYRSDVNKLLKIADIVLAASRREGLGLNLIEAICAGCPVIATHNRGHNEIIIAGKNGYFANNEEEFQKYIKIILKNQMKPDIKTIDRFCLKNVEKDMKIIYKIK